MGDLRCRTLRSGPFRSGLGSLLLPLAAAHKGGRTGAKLGALPLGLTPPDAPLRLLIVRFPAESRQIEAAAPLQAVKKLPKFLFMVNGRPSCFICSCFLIIKKDFEGI